MPSEDNINGVGAPERNLADVLAQRSERIRVLEAKVGELRALAGQQEEPVAKDARNAVMLGVAELYAAFYRHGADVVRQRLSVEMALANLMRAYDAYLD